MKLKNLFLKSLFSIIAMAVCAFVLPASAQTAAPPTASALSQINAAIPNIVGTVFTYKGQQFLLTTNATGGIDVATFGPQGSNIVAVATTPQQAFEVASAYITGNNPANSGYYATNEVVAKLGAAYLQNSGSALAFIGVEKYGLFGWRNVGFGGGVLQGNNGTKTGTAGFYAEAVYRKIIGDTAGEIGPIIGYDLWDKQIFGGVKVGVEHRQSNHLGEFVDLFYAIEPGSKSDKGTGVAGGIEYIF